MAGPTSGNRSEAPSVHSAQVDQRFEHLVRPSYETVARDIARRARRRLFAAMLPLLFLVVLLAYVLARYGL